MRKILLWVIHMIVRMPRGPIGNLHGAGNILLHPWREQRKFPAFCLEIVRGMGTDTMFKSTEETGTEEVLAWYRRPILALFLFHSQHRPQGKKFVPARFAA